MRRELAEQVGIIPDPDVGMAGWMAAATHPSASYLESLVTLTPTGVGVSIPLQGGPKDAWHAAWYELRHFMGKEEYAGSVNFRVCFRRTVRDEQGNWFAWMFVVPSRNGGYDPQCLDQEVLAMSALDENGDEQAHFPELPDPPRTHRLYATLLDWRGQHAEAQILRDAMGWNVDNPKPSGYPYTSSSEGEEQSQPAGRAVYFAENHAAWRDTH